MVLDGWEKSEGARREVEVAAAHGIPIYDEQWVSDTAVRFRFPVRRRDEGVTPCECPSPTE